MIGAIAPIDGGTVVEKTGCIAAIVGIIIVLLCMPQASVEKLVETVGRHVYIRSRRARATVSLTAEA